MTCDHCSVSVEAAFEDSPLSRLPMEHQRFIELFVIAGGSLKEIAAQAGVSYPTVRSRLDKVIEQLQLEISSSAQKPAKKQGKDNRAAEILKRI